ncbi:MAG: hypothetical protein ACLP59_26610, partial [Bryobacteraceae bacterium]
MFSVSGVVFLSSRVIRAQSPERSRWTTGQNRTHMVNVSKDLKTVFASNVNSATISIIAQGQTQGP